MATRAAHSMLSGLWAQHMHTDAECRVDHAADESIHHFQASRTHFCMHYMQEDAVCRQQRTAHSMLSGLRNAFGCTTFRQVLMCRADHAGRCLCVGQIVQQMAVKTSPMMPSGFKKAIACTTCRQMLCVGHTVHPMVARTAHPMLSGFKNTFACTTSVQADAVCRKNHAADSGKDLTYEAFRQFDAFRPQEHILRAVNAGRCSACRLLSMYTHTLPLFLQF